jgi:predicted lipid-binding transport protein (Tim44 family)
MQPYNQSYQEQPPYTVPSPTPSNQPAPYVGNQKDMMAFAAMIAGAGLLASSCIPGFSCILPIFALVGGIIGLRGADQAINPSRTRTYSWIAIVSGTLVLLFFIAVIVFYGAVIAAAIQEANQEF